MDMLGPRLGVFRASVRVLWRLVGSLLLVPVFVFGFLVPLVWIYRIGVHHLGLYAFNAHGRYFPVSWGTITGAQRVDMLLLPYLRILTTEAGVELVIPLFLARQREFEHLVIKYAGSQNPLSSHFVK